MLPSGKKETRKKYYAETNYCEWNYFVRIPYSWVGGRKKLSNVTQFPIKWMAHPQVLFCWWEEELGQSDLALEFHFRSLVLCKPKSGACCSCLPLRAPASIFCQIRPGLFVRFRLEKNGSLGFTSFCFALKLHSLSVLVLTLNQIYGL